MLSSRSERPLKTLDRYLIRETLTPFFIALGLFTFALLAPPMLERAEQLLAKHVPLPTVGLLLTLLLPQALGVTIPMAFLTAILMALGRVSGDREGVALLACGVSPMRIFAPILAMAVIVAGADLYVMTSLIADSNQAFRNISFRFLAEQSEADIKPGQFYENFPGKVLYVSGTHPDGGWAGVMLADTSQPESPAPTVYLAARGKLVADKASRSVNLFLNEAYQYTAGKDSDTYQASEPVDDAPLRLSIPAESVFGSGEAINLTRGLAELRIPDLLRELREKPKRVSQERPFGEPAHGEVIYLMQMFAFPVACLVFAPIGLALGLHTRREGKLAGMTMGLAVVGAYYAIMIQAEAMTKGYYSGVNGGALWNAGHVLPAYMARWIPNIVLGAVGIGALLLKRRAAGRGLQLRLPRWLSRKRDDATAVAASARGTGRVVVVLRVPSFHVPRPRLLDVYVSRTYLRMGMLAFVALLGLYYLGAFLDRIEKLFKGQATSELMFQFLWYSTPQFVAFIVPLATLVAGLGTIGALSRTGELTIMRASGVSLYRAAMPLLFFAALWSGMLFVLDDRVVARANQRADALDNMIRGLPPHTENVLENRHWLVADNGAVYYYQFYDARNRRLHRLSVFEPTSKPPYRLMRHSHATLATFEAASGTWIAERGWIQSFPSVDRSKHEPFVRKSLPLESPDKFESAQVDTEVMTYTQLRQYIHQRSANGFSLSDQQMSLQRKLAFPAVTIVMTLLAVPFGVTTGKRGALYGIGLAIVLAVAYFLVTAFFNAAGRADVLPAWFAAWAANILFLSAAAYLTLRVRT